LSSKAVRDAFRAYLAANWTTTPIVAVTNEFTTPPSLSPWVALQFLAGTEEQVSLGSPGYNIFRESGTVFIHVIVPTGTGDEVALGYAETLRTLFRGATFGGVRCFAIDPPSTEPGTTVLADDGAFFGCSMACDYIFDVIG
jgi:Bacteriophage related domain of unknown function